MTAGDTILIAFVVAMLVWVVLMIIALFGVLIVDRDQRPRKTP